MSNIKLSRRQVVIGAGALSVGVVAGQIINPFSRAEAKGGKTEKWPWPYVKLDPTETAEIAYHEWYRIYCGGAVISSIFSQLREKLGEPYRSFPIDSFMFLEGGVAGWGTICGSVMGANIVTNCMIGPRYSGATDGLLMGSEILDWYTKTALPVYVPKNPKVSPKRIPHTTSNSPLCHISVGRWMKAANKPFKSPERRDRCARVTASVAYHLVELLNQWKEGEYDTEGEIPSGEFGITAQYNCEDCHGSNVPSPPEETARKSKK